jgi:hypothetical protein
VIVVLYKGVDLPFEITGQIVVVEQNAVPWMISLLGGWISDASSSHPQ